MCGRITEKFIKCLEKPATGSKITYDSEINGFGFRLSNQGTALFILNYSIFGRERRITIGKHPVWTAAEARAQASKLRLMIDNGIDPLAEREEKRAAWTVRDLSEEYSKSHLPHLSPASQKDVTTMWDNHILPTLGAKKLTNLTSRDIDELHHRIDQKTPVRANRVLEVLRHALNLAVRWGHIERNPAQGFKRKTVIGAGPHRSWQRTKIHKEPDNEPLQEGFSFAADSKNDLPFFRAGVSRRSPKTIIQI